MGMVFAGALVFSWFFVGIWGLVTAESAMLRA